MFFHDFDFTFLNLNLPFYTSPLPDGKQALPPLLEERGKNVNGINIDNYIILPPRF